ncbi:PTS fructose transporter IIABC, partial [Enterococcus faecalis]
MKIVGIAACTAGIAHTYIAKEKLLQAAESL